ncbi:hypothetical protein ACFTWS_07765 [Streptomyces sp. NPDC057027]|uniref:hypothetical protein n=1 Tax=Streptomyces sp. NPDC057027 TaxID=3346004 RepID=UPI003628F040
MDTHAHGVDEVKALEASLGFRVPDPGTTEAACRDLIRVLEARVRRQEEEAHRAAELSRPFSDALLGTPVLEKAMEQMRADQKSRMTEEVTPSHLHQTPVSSLDAQFRASVNFAVKVPPYDGDFATGAGARVDKNLGTFSLDVQVFGGSDSCYLSFGSWFYTPQDNPFQRFAAPIEFNKHWRQHAMGYVAHSNFSTVVSVHDGTTNTDAMPPIRVQPSWSDGVGWAEEHGEDVDGDFTIAEVFFPATAGHVYFCQLAFSASVDSDSGLFGFADSTIHLNGRVPRLVLGSLF